MKGSFKVVVISIITLLLLTIGVVTVKKVFIDKSSNDLVNINQLSQKFMNEYFEDYEELSKLDNKENILIVSTKKKLKETYGATKVVKAPNYQYFLQYEDEASKNNAKSKLEDNKDLIYVEENVVRTIASDTTSQFGYLWGIETMGLSKAKEYSNTKDLEEVVVAVIDTGINEDLFNSYYEGRIKDTHISSTLSIIDDSNGHGTHISGIIAEATADNVKLLPIKVSNEETISSVDLINAINYIVKNNNADVINMSFGGSEYSEAEYIAIESAKENNIICVAAAGNENSEADYYPAAYDNTISVSAVDIDLNRYSNSNYGDTIDFTAPGDHIEGLYGSKEGTSMSAAHVSSVVAVLKSYNKDINLDNTIEILKEHTLDLGEDGYDEYYGNGFITLNNLEFCDGETCDEYNIFKESDNDNIVNIEAPETYTLEYDYLTNTNIMNIEFKFYYTEEDYYTKQLWELEDALIENYDATLQEDQQITIKYNDLVFSILIDYEDDTVFGWAYEVNSDNENNISLTEIYMNYSKPLKKVIVPSIIDGYTTTVIGTNLFDYEEDIVEVVLPDTIEVIGDGSFSNSKANVVIPNSVKEIGDGAFFYSKIKSVVMPNSVVTIGDSAFSYSELEELTLSNNLEKISMYAFMGTKLKSITIPSSVKEIGDGAFMFCSNLEEVTLNEGLETIGLYAFDNMPIKSINIPSTVTDINQKAFYWLENLENITISEGNNNYYTEESSNTIIQTVTNRLVYANKNSKIPNSVDIIGANAFDYKAFEITLPEGVETIGKDAFSSINTETLEKVQLPKSITSIADGVFDSFENLTLYVYEDSYSLEYAIANNVAYKIIDYKEVSVNKEEIATNYEAYCIPDTTNIEVTVSYEDEDGNITEEVITDGFTIEYQTAEDSFRYGDTYFIVKGTTSTGSEYEVPVEINVEKTKPCIIDLTLMPYIEYDGKPHGLDLNLHTGNILESYIVKFANEDGEYVLDSSPKYTEIGEYIIKYKAYFVNEDGTPNESFYEFYSEYKLGIWKNQVTPTITIQDKVYDGTNSIDLSSIDVEITELDIDDYTITQAYSTTTDAGQTTANVTIKLSDEAFETNALREELQEKEYTVDMNILPQSVEKPTLVDKVYTYTGEEQTLEINNFDENKMNIEGNVQTNAGEYNVIVSLKNSNYIWEDETTDNIEFNYVINKSNIEDYITDDTKDSFVLFDNTPKSIELDIDSNLEYTYKFANEEGEYVLDEAPKYIEIGSYIIKYKVYIDNNYTEYYNEVEFVITKGVLTPTITIQDKVYDGTNNIDLSSIDVEFSVLEDGDFTIKEATTTTTDAGATTAKIVIKLSDEASLSYELNEKEYIVDMNILPQSVVKPTLEQKEYVYNGSIPTLVLNNFDATKMTIEGNDKINVGSYGITIELINSNYVWEDDTTTNYVVYNYIIVQADINDYIIDRTQTPAYPYDGTSKGIEVDIESDLNYIVKFANEEGEYVLDESLKYIEKGSYTIKYQVYINSNYTVYENEINMLIFDDEIVDSTTDKEVLYDGKEHTLDIKLNIDDYQVQYSLDDKTYSTTVPKYKNVGEYTIYYKILVENIEKIKDSKKVKIYGINGNTSNINIKNNIIITKNNSFSNLITNFDIYANKHSKAHYDSNNNLVTAITDKLKTTDIFVIKFTGFGEIKYSISLLGDINCDSKITSADYIKIKKHIMETEKIKENIYFYAADVNDDNTISSKDYIKIRKYIMNGESL